MGRPVVMVDHEYSWADGATMLGSPHWRCVWFDPIVAVFVHDSAEEAVRLHPVDFATRHFRPEATSRDRSLAERAASPRPSAIISAASRPIARTWSGRSSGSAWTNARGILRDEPDSVVGWKMLGQIEIGRDPAPVPPPSPRYRLPFDPVADLSLVRATYAMRRALEGNPDDLTAPMTLDDVFALCGMHEEALKVLDRLEQRVAHSPSATGLLLLEQLGTKRQSYVSDLGEPPPSEWRNMAELDRLVTTLLSQGRARTAADVLEKANPPERAPWDMLDRMATLRLHLGEPARRGPSGSRGWARHPIRRSRRPGSPRLIWPRRTSRRPDAPTAVPWRKARALRGMLRPRDPRAGCR